MAGFDPAVGTVAFAASLDAPVGWSFANLIPLIAEVRSVDGTLIASYLIDDLTTETAVVVMELYRRESWWKIRAVGQGYDDGLAGLARDFGVNVGDDQGAPPTPDVQSSAVDWRNPPVPAGYELTSV